MLVLPAHRFQQKAQQRGSLLAFERVSIPPPCPVGCDVGKLPVAPNFYEQSRCKYFCSILSVDSIRFRFSFSGSIAVRLVVFYYYVVRVVSEQGGSGVKVDAT